MSSLDPLSSTLAGPLLFPSLFSATAFQLISELVSSVVPLDLFSTLNCVNFSTLSIWYK